MEEKVSSNRFDIMIIGDEKVGKTTILERYFKREFNSERKKTIGIEKYPKKYTDPISLKTFDVVIWDTAGQERFKSVTKNYYRKADAMIITMAITNKSSFSNIKMWINSITENTTKPIPLVVFCNKYDLEDEREVSNYDIERFCSEENLKFFYTSAKDGHNIDTGFEYIFKEVCKAEKKKILVDLSISGDDDSKSKCC